MTTPNERSAAAALSTMSRQQPLSYLTQSLSSDTPSHSFAEDESGTVRQLDLEEERDITTTMTSAEVFFNGREDNDKLRVLLTMTIGLEKDYRQDDRMLEHIRKGRIKKGELLIAGVREYVNKITCWATVFVTKLMPRP